MLECLNVFKAKDIQALGGYKLLTSTGNIYNALKVAVYNDLTTVLLQD